MTDGVRVLARVERLAADAAVSPLWYGTDGCPGLYLTGGTGIGVVTRRGLACPEGRHAINPVPRAMIFQAAERALREAGGQAGERGVFDSSVHTGGRGFGGPDLKTPRLGPLKRRASRCWAPAAL